MTKVALVQLQACVEKERNLEAITGYIGEAAGGGAELIAFPEYMMLYTPSSQTPAQLARMAEGLDGHFVGEVAAAAKKHSIQVVGTIYERSATRNRVYDTAFFLNHRGRLLSTYRKIHLYDALGFRESRKMVAGSEMPKPAGSRAGTLGMMICYDLRFPEMARGLALAGSQVIVAPSAWVQGECKEDHWVTLNKARAVENGCYVVSPDQVGNIYCGRSLVVDPYGTVLLDMEKRRGMEMVDISLDTLRKTRRILPLLKNRRPQVY